MIVMVQDKDIRDAAGCETCIWAFKESEKVSCDHPKGPQIYEAGTCWRYTKKKP